nr:uncharacterized protein LOC122174688 [Chrysemys picta bellii]
MYACPLTLPCFLLPQHVHFWLQSENTQERVRAIRCSAALLQFATSLPGFDTSSDFPKAGNFVLQLGLYISDPANDISQQARSGIQWLQRLLLQRRGLNIPEASHLWCRDRLQDTEHLAYRNMARVGEVFGQIFSEGQRISFLQAALLAIHDPQVRVSQAGLVLTYSILGEVGQLIGDESCSRHPTDPLQHCLLLLIFPKHSDFDYPALTLGLYLDSGLTLT